MKKIFITIVLLGLLMPTVYSQESSGQGFKPHSYYSLDWSISIPLGDFNEFISITSPAGGSFSGKYIIPQDIVLGFLIGWNNYYEKFARATYYFEDGLAVTASHYRYSYTIPFLFMMGYQFKPQNIISPFFTLGIGGDYMEQHIIIQNWDFYDDQWGFVLTPEIGALIKFGPFSHWGAEIKANYWFNTNSFSFGNKDYNLMQGINLSVGLSYLVR